VATGRGTGSRQRLRRRPHHLEPDHAGSTESPVGVDGRKLKRTALWHFSWWRVLTEAIVQHRYRGISDPDRASLLYAADQSASRGHSPITLARAMESKRGKAEGSFVRETRAQTFDFYRDIVQQLKTWQARRQGSAGQTPTKSRRRPHPSRHGSRERMYVRSVKPPSLMPPKQLPRSAGCRSPCRAGSRRFRRVSERHWL
jgi:hypothetical protein